MLRETAEYPNSFVSLAPGQERIEGRGGRYTLCLERSVFGATVQRQNFAAEELDAVLAEVRGLLRERGRTQTQWEIGSGARPHGLSELLLARGLRLDDDPVATAVALTGPPPARPPGFTVRPVSSPQEYAAARGVQEVAFAVPPARVEENRRQAAADFAATRDVRIMHAVWDEATGEIVGAGSSGLTPHALALFGGAVLPQARGRGAYRALIAERWAEAERRGLGALVTQAGAMSRPILERLGFAAVGRVTMLVDEFAPIEP